MHYVQPSSFFFFFFLARKEPLPYPVEKVKSI